MLTSSALIIIGIVGLMVLLFMAQFILYFVIGVVLVLFLFPFVAVLGMPLWAFIAILVLIVFLRK
jgi:hypothetical protein